MAFPGRIVREAYVALRPILSGWISDPVPPVDDQGEPLATKYFGKWSADAQITAEIQIVGLLIGLFWEVEHSAIYKPTPGLHGIRTDVVLQRRDDVLAALMRFESEFERAMTSGDNAGSSPTAAS